MRNRVSVLIPTYNGARYLGETLHSVLNQSYAPAEVIIVDDGATDNTRDVVAGFGDRVRYCYTENGGICRARNLAASLATGDFLAFCDHDDLWRSDKLEQQMRLHSARPDVQYSFTNFALVEDGVWAQMTEFDHAPDRSFPPYSLPGTDPVVLDTPFADKILSFQPIRPSTILLSTPFFHRIGGFRNELGKNPSEDVEFALRCLQHPPIGIVREPVVGIRKHGGNYSGSDLRNLIGQKEIFEYVLEHHKPSNDMRVLLEEEIVQRRLEASYHAFHQGRFSEFIALLAPIERSRLNGKVKLKLLLAKCPGLARVAQKLLTR